MMLNIALICMFVFVRWWNLISNMNHHVWQLGSAEIQIATSLIARNSLILFLIPSFAMSVIKV